MRGKPLLTESKHKRVILFDFDNTLFTSNNYTTVIKPDGTTIKLNAGDYALYDVQPGDILDYSNFEDVLDPEIANKSIFRTFKRAIHRYGVDNVAIVTARGKVSEPAIRKTLLQYNIPKIKIYTVDSTDPNAKVNVIINNYVNKGYNWIEFFDDSVKNIDAVSKLKYRFSHLIIKTHLVGEYHD